MPPRLAHSAAAGLAALLLGVGLARFAFPPLIPALVAEGWFDAPTAGYLGATNFAGYLAGAFAAQRLAGTPHAGRAVRAALALGTLSLAAEALQAGFPWHAAWRFVAGFIGGILMVLAAPAILAATPARLRGRVAGVMFTGVGLGIMLSGLLVPRLAHEGVAVAWLALAGMAALLSLVAWRGIPDAGAATARPAARVPAMSRPVLGLVLAYAIYGAGFVPHTLFWADFVARGLGRGIVAGGHAWVTLGIGAVLGPLASGLLAERIGFRAALPLVLVTIAASAALPAVADGPVALAFSAVLTGALGVGVSTVVAGRIAELVGPAQQARIWGAATIAFSVAYMAGGYLFAFVLAATGSFRLVFALAGAALAAAALVELALRAPAARP